MIIRPLGQKQTMLRSGLQGEDQPSALYKVVDGDLGSQNNDPMEKDEAEIELEKAVFGDAKGFYDELTSRGDKPLNFLNHQKQDGAAVTRVLEDEGLEGLDNTAVRP